MIISFIDNFCCIANSGIGSILKSRTVRQANFQIITGLKADDDHKPV